MNREQADQALHIALDASTRRAELAHPRVRPFYSLAAKFARHALVATHPGEVPKVIEDLRAIHRGASIVARRVAQ